MASCIAEQLLSAKLYDKCIKMVINGIANGVEPISQDTINHVFRKAIKAFLHLYAYAIEVFTEYESSNDIAKNLILYTTQKKQELIEELNSKCDELIKEISSNRYGEGSAEWISLNILIIEIQLKKLKYADITKKEKIKTYVDANFELIKKSIINDAENVMRWWPSVCYAKYIIKYKGKKDEAVKKIKETLEEIHLSVSMYSDETKSLLQYSKDLLTIWINS